MKTIILLTLTLGISLSAGEPLAKSHQPKRAKENETRDFFVSKSGKDQVTLDAVYNAVRKLELGSKPKGSDYKVFRRIDSNQFIVNRKVMKCVGTDVDPLTRIGFLMDDRRTDPRRYSKVVDYEKTFWLILSNPVNVADGEEIKNLAVVETEEIKNDNGSSYRILKESNPEKSDPFSKEEFVNQLKAGKTWKLRNFLDNSCHSCLGSGKMSPMQNGKTCDSCKGTGKIMTDYLVRW